MKHFSPTISIHHKIKFSILKITIPEIDCDFSLLKTEDGDNKFQSDKFSASVVFIPSRFYGDSYFNGRNIRLRQENNDMRLEINKSESDIYVGFVISLLLEFDNFIDKFQKSEDDRLAVISIKGTDFRFTKSKEAEELANLLIKGIENSRLKSLMKEVNMK